MVPSSASKNSKVQLFSRAERYSYPGSMSSGYDRGFIKGWALGKVTCCMDDLSAWFDHLEDSFSYKEVLFTKF